MPWARVGARTLGRLAPRCGFARPRAVAARGSDRRGAAGALSAGQSVSSRGRRSGSAGSGVRGRRRAVPTRGADQDGQDEDAGRDDERRRQRDRHHRRVATHADATTMTTAKIASTAAPSAPARSAGRQPAGTRGRTTSAEQRSPSARARRRAPRPRRPARAGRDGHCPCGTVVSPMTTPVPDQQRPRGPAGRAARRPASRVMRPRTSIRSSHFVCRTPGRFGAISRAGIPVVEVERLAAEPQRDARCRGAARTRRAAPTPCTTRPPAG